MKKKRTARAQAAIDAANITAAKKQEQQKSVELNELPRDTDGLIIWNTEEGIIAKLRKVDFFSEIPADNDDLKKEALASFYTYKAAISDAYADELEERMNTARETAHANRKKAEFALHEPTEKERRIMEIKAYETKINKWREELSITDEDLDNENRF